MSGSVFTTTQKANLRFQENRSELKGTNSVFNRFAQNTISEIGSFKYQSSFPSEKKSKRPPN